MTLITLNANEYPNGLYNKYHKIYLSGPFGISVLRHPNHLRYLRARVIENIITTQRFLAAPVEANREFFLAY